MNTAERKAFLLSHQDDASLQALQDQGILPDNMEIRHRMAVHGIGAIDPVSGAISVISSIFGGKKPLHPDVVPNQPKTWHKSTATGYPFQSYTDGNGTTHVVANGRDYNLDNSGDNAAWNALKVTVPPVSVLAAAPPSVGGTLGTVNSGGAISSILPVNASVAGVSLSSPLVLGAIALGAYFLLKRRR